MSKVTSQGRASVLTSFADSTAFREVAGTLYRETLWLIPDNLGTPRMIAERTGSLTGMKRHDYLPFGEEVKSGVAGRTSAQGYVSDNVRQQFTDKERDNETGLDYFGARYYSSSLGRFTSIDPLLASGRVSRPQSWNRYTYVLNNPLRLIDPDGLQEQDPPKGESGIVELNPQDTVRVYTIIDGSKSLTLPSIIDYAKSLLDAFPSLRTDGEVDGGGGGGAPTGGMGGDVGGAGGGPELIIIEGELVEAIESPKLPSQLTPAEENFGNMAGATRGMDGRVLGESEVGEFNSFAERTRAAGLTENPNRTGDWGRVGDNGKFKSVVRIDVGEPGKSGESGRTHLHIAGEKEHLPLTTKFPGEK